MTTADNNNFLANVQPKRWIALAALPLILLAGCGKAETTTPSTTQAAPGSVKPSETTATTSAPETTTSAPETSASSESPEETKSAAPTGGTTTDGSLTVEIEGKSGFGPYTAVQCATNGDALAMSAQESGTLKLFGAVVGQKTKDVQGATFMSSDGYTFASVKAKAEIEGNVYKITGTGDGIDGTKPVQGVKFTFVVTCK